MKGFQIQQKGERRISAALRIMLVIFLLAVQIALVVAISYFMQEYLALAYAVVQVAALFLAIHIYNEPGELSYKLIWFILLLLAPPVGMILWFLWGGAAQKRHLPQNGKRVPDEPESVRKRSALAVERLTRQLPGWSRTANYLCRRDFQLYQDTRVTYLPEGALLLRELIEQAKKAERFIFLEYFILAEGQLWSELEKLLCGSHVRQTLLRFPRELAYIVPCIEAMDGFDQHNPWHIYDVWEHTAAVVENTPAYPLVRWAALFHDAGKPDTFLIGADNLGHMPNHPIASVQHMRESAKTLHFSKKMQHDLDLVIRYHGDRPEPTTKSVRKLYALVEHNEDLFHAICDLMRGDARGKSTRATKWIQKINAAESLFNEMLKQGEVLSPADLPVNGTDLIPLGVPQGPHVGLVLSELFSAVANEEVAPEREALLALARRFMQS